MSEKNPMFLSGEYRSKSLCRTQPYLFSLPEGAEAEGERRYPLLVMLHGRTGNFRDWADCSRLSRHLSKFNLVVALPDGGENGWYSNAVGNGERYEDDLIQDFLPHLQNTLPILSPGKNWGISGLSMGGYGAVKIALKHWELFSVGASHSGALNVAARPVAHAVFGEPEADREMRKDNNVFWLAEQALCRLPVERPRLHIDCGLSDPLLGESKMFSDHLNFLGYSHDYRELQGHHAWPYWDRAFRTLLPTLAQELGADRLATPRAKL